MTRPRSTSIRLKQTLINLGQNLIRSETAFDCVRHGERLLKYMQGKGTGAFTTDMEVRAILPLLRPANNVVFDVGANKGQWTRSLLTHATGRIRNIYAFEPAEANVQHLKGLALEAVIIVPFAVGKAAGHATLYSDRLGSGRASLYVGDDIPRKLSDVVTVICLDEFAAQNDVEHIDFIKMDIEGHELAAIEGAARLFKERRIRAFSFEFGGSNVNSRTFFRDFWRALVRFDFDLFRIVAGPRLLPIRQYTDDLECFFSATNYVATLKG